MPIKNAPLVKINISEKRQKKKLKKLLTKADSRGKIYKSLARETSSKAALDL